MTAARPVALVTGATSGIGKAAALALAGAGFEVIGTGSGCRPATSPCSAAWPPSWPATTAPPNSNAASTSCSPGSPPP